MPTAYAADEATIEWSTPHLKAFLKDLAARAKPSRIHVIAHSMGSRAVVRALHELQIEQPGRSLLRQLILAAPDIDIGVMKQLSKSISMQADRVTLYASATDHALQVSGFLHQYNRAGEVASQIHKSIEVVDATGHGDLTALRHGFYSDSWSVLTDMFLLTRYGEAPEDRFGLTPVPAGPAGSGVFWRLTK